MEGLGKTFPCRGQRPCQPPTSATAFHGSDIVLRRPCQSPKELCYHTKKTESTPSLEI